MDFSKPKVTIDLDEYNYLKGVEELTESIEKKKSEEEHLPSLLEKNDQELWDEWNLVLGEMDRLGKKLEFIKTELNKRNNTKTIDI